MKFNEAIETYPMIQRTGWNGKGLFVFKQIPSEVAVVPDAPTLLNDNFKVVQINKHLTDTEDTKLINDLHSQKNNLKTKLEQINNAIIQKNQDLSVKKYASVSERDKDVAELAKLIKDQETYTTNYYSITTQLKSKTDIINKVDPKFRIRGFQPNMPNLKFKLGQN